MAGIYLHIPFCKQACSYCDFFFVTRTGYREAFVDKLIEEIRSYCDTPYVEEPVKTIYFGGGTPSLLKLGEIERILNTLGEVFQVDSEEITLEMNPDDVTREYLQGLLDLGVNRSSMGVQSFQPELLEFMNRAHSREEALECLELLHAAGFDTFTVDLIYGNPGQSLQDLEEDLGILLEFDPPHISAYSLTVEPKTRLGRQVELGRIRPPGDEEVAAHFDLVVDRLQESGLLQYEISNYSRAGHEAIHNSSYWRHENYIGLGPAAHSFWWSSKTLRWKNRSDLKVYLDEPFTEIREADEQLTPPQLAEERLMMGLRTRKGLAFEELENRYGYEIDQRQRRYMKQKEREGKMKVTERGFCLTKEGMKIADTLILDMVTLK